MKNIKYIALGLLAMTGIALTSCSDDDNYDVTGNPNNLVYFKANATNTFSCTVAHTPFGDVGHARILLPVKSNAVAAGSIGVKAAVDNSLVDAYNKANNTSYAAAPEGTVEFEKATATISAGQQMGDTIVAVLGQSQLASLTAETYVVPIRVAEVTGSGAPSGERGVAWLVINTKTSMINEEGRSADMTGSLITDCGAWTARYDSGTEIAPAQLFDQDVTNGPQLRADGADGKTKTIIVDMQESKNVTGLRVARYYKSWYGGWWVEDYYFSSVKVEASTDGSAWSAVGSLTEDQMEKRDGYQYIVYYGGMPTRYLRLTIESGSSSVSSLAELGVYAE